MLKVFYRIAVEDQLRVALIRPGDSVIINEVVLYFYKANRVEPREITNSSLTVYLYGKGLFYFIGMVLSIH